MNVLNSDQGFFDRQSPGIFLAGPTPRKATVKSWRPNAIEILEKLGFTGTVLVPERKDWSVKFDYTDQVDWEHDSMANAKAIVIWVPRCLETMPAFTTNVEFGYWLVKRPEAVLYGRPDLAPNTRYLDWLYVKETARPVHDSLESLLQSAIDKTN